MYSKSPINLNNFFSDILQFDYSISKFKYIIFYFACYPELLWPYNSLILSSGKFLADISPCFFVIHSVLCFLQSILLTALSFCLYLIFHATFWVNSLIPSSNSLFFNEVCSVLLWKIVFLKTTKHYLSPVLHASCNEVSHSCQEEIESVFLPCEPRVSPMTCLTNRL